MLIQHESSQQQKIDSKLTQNVIFYVKSEMGLLRVDGRGRWGCGTKSYQDCFNLAVIFESPRDGSALMI